jgi:hypothetical protein
MTSAGLRIIDTSTVIESAHNVCAYLHAGHSKWDAIMSAVRNNPTVTLDNATVVVDSAVQVYCPGRMEVD